MDEIIVCFPNKYTIESVDSRDSTKARKTQLDTLKIRIDWNEYDPIGFLENSGISPVTYFRKFSCFN